MFGIWDFLRYTKLKIIYRKEMKQKDILLWTITIAALLLSVLATFGSRINGVQTFAAKRPVVATQSQISTPINSTPIYNGGTVTANGQGPAGCAALEQALNQALNDPNMADALGQGIATFIQLCGGLNSQFCSDLDQAGAHQQTLINNTTGDDIEDQVYWRNILFAAHKLFCGGNGGGGGSINPNQPGYQDSGESEDLLGQLCTTLNLHTGPCAGY